VKQNFYKNQSKVTRQEAKQCKQRKQSRQESAVPPKRIYERVTRSSEEQEQQGHQKGRNQRRRINPIPSHSIYVIPIICLLFTIFNYLFFKSIIYLFIYSVIPLITYIQIENLTLDINNK
jgi:hypothetical protein